MTPDDDEATCREIAARVFDSDWFPDYTKGALLNTARHAYAAGLAAGRGQGAPVASSPVSTVDSACRCGSGAHPRRCAVHPWAYDAHVADLSIDSISDDLMELDARVAALEAASDVSQLSEDNLASQCKGLDERVLALETWRGALKDVPEGIQHEYVNDGKKRCEVCGLSEGNPCHALGAHPAPSTATSSLAHVCSPNKWSDECGGWICLCGKDLSANWYVAWRKENL